MNVASVATGLRRDVRDPVAADHVPAKEVAPSESQDHLGPPSDAKRSVSHFKREVPDNPPVCLLALVSMLRYPLLNALRCRVNKDKRLTATTCHSFWVDWISKWQQIPSESSKVPD